MAKKRSGGPNKSAAIREYLKDHPKAGPTEVCKELKKKGLTVAPALVSNVKAAMLGKKKKGTKKKPGRKPGRPVGSGRKPGRPAGGGGDKVSLSSLIQAREFVDKVGGPEKAQELIKALAKLG